ncbi:MAG: hypothetical protein ACKOC4_11900 [Planctomycetia bacterium]
MPLPDAAIDEPAADLAGQGLDRPGRAGEPHEQGRAAGRHVELPFSPDTLTRLARSRYEPDALDVPPGGQTLLVRLAGPGRAIETCAAEIGGHVVDGAVWDRIRETPWRFATAITPAEMPHYAAAHVSGAGSVAWSLEPPLRGLTVRGPEPLWLGDRPRYAIEDAVKLALDPHHRFPGLDN